MKNIYKQYITINCDICGDEYTKEDKKSSILGKRRNICRKGSCISKSNTGNWGFGTKI